jgi:hypothetical protein
VAPKAPSKWFSVHGIYERENGRHASDQVHGGPSLTEAKKQAEQAHATGKYKFMHLEQAGDRESKLIGRFGDEGWADVGGLSQPPGHTAMKPPAGHIVCSYCGADNPDSEEVCPDTGGRHSLISASDKQELGQGYGPGPGTDGKAFENSDIAKQAHGFAQTDTVKHCPFCGSGDVWGGSDGTITCEFCDATFNVSVEPSFPSAPGSIDGNPLNMGGDPDPMGQADGGDGFAGAEGVAAGQQGPPPGEEEGGNPFADGEEGEPDDEEDEEPEEGGGPPPFPPKGSSLYRTDRGDPLPEPLYLKHLAIRHAQDRRQLLGEMRRAG